jgi:hypothetical protein
MEATMTRIRRFVLVAALFVLAMRPAFSQAFYGSIVGTVTDQSAAVLHGAVVTLTNLATGERRQTPSGAGGDYQFLNLVPGTYRVEVERPGFKKANDKPSRDRWSSGGPAEEIPSGRRIASSDDSDKGLAFALPTMGQVPLLRHCGRRPTE